jgi:hypothetical protein
MGAVFVAEKVWTVRDAGWKAKLLASTLFIELLYDTFLGIIFVKGSIDMALRKQAHWGDVPVPSKRAIAKQNLQNSEMEK